MTTKLIFDCLDIAVDLALAIYVIYTLNRINKIIDEEE